MVSYFKTQWFNLLIGLAYLGVSFYYFIQDNNLWAIGYLLVAAVWLIMSRVDYNNDRIATLEKKAEKYDALVKEVHAMRELQQTSDKLTDQRLEKLEGKTDVLYR